MPDASPIPSNFAAGQLPVYISGQRRQKIDFCDMFFPVQDGLVEMGDAPALRNRIVEQGGQFSDAWPVKLLRQVRNGVKNRLSC